MREYINFLDDFIIMMILMFRPDPSSNNFTGTLTTTGNRGPVTVSGIYDKREITINGNQKSISYRFSLKTGDEDNQKYFGKVIVHFYPGILYSLIGTRCLNNPKQ